MGECGCSGMGKFFKLPGPDGCIYIIRKYPGCNYCSTPIGVDIQEIDPEHSDFDFFNDYDELELHKDRDYIGFIDFFSEEDIQRALTKHLMEHMAFREKDEPFDEIEAEICAEEFAENFMRNGGK